MKVEYRIEGLEKVIQGLNESIAKTEGMTIGGLMAAGALIQRESQKRVPIAFGKLRASAYTRKSGRNAVVVGYSAAYAAAVHENVEMKLRGKPRRRPKGTFYWGPKGESKFLEKAARAMRSQVVKTIKDFARKKK